MTIVVLSITYFLLLIVYYFTACVSKLQYHTLSTKILNSNRLYNNNAVHIVSPLTWLLLTFSTVLFKRTQF
jgi:hypothetical protein